MAVSVGPGRSCGYMKPHEAPGTAEIQVVLPFTTWEEEREGEAAVGAAGSLFCCLGTGGSSGFRHFTQLEVTRRKAAESLNQQRNGSHCGKDKI